jgi:uncharacterized protein (TIGR02611 family)
MNDDTVTPRAQALLTRLDEWAHRGTARGMVVKAVVTVLGPLVVLAGLVMTVLPGPGLVVVALGLALLALEYDWARATLRRMGRSLGRARRAALPEDSSRGRRALGVLSAGAFVVATTALTAAVTSYVGALTLF